METELVLVPAEPRPPKPSVAGGELAAREPDAEKPPETVEEEAEPEVAAIFEVEEPETGKEPTEPDQPKPKEPRDVAVAEEREPAETAEAEEADLSAAETGRETTRPEDEIEERPDVPITTSLDTESYYIQLAVYSDVSYVERVVGSLSDIYPVTVFRSEGAKPLYKVMLGPLSKDESGSLLFAFRTRGYPDAFIRKGN